jgi:hypothetical protein
MLRKTLIIVVAILAVTGSTATAAKLITGKDIKNSSVTGADIKNKSLGVGELSASARKALTGQTGPAGPAGPAGAKGADGKNGTNGAKGDKGDKGDQGVQGLRGPSNALGIRIASSTTINSADDSREIIGTSLNEGVYAVSAKFIVKNNHAVDISRPDCELGIGIGQDQLFYEIDQTDVPVGVEDDTEEDVITLSGVAVVESNNADFLVRCKPSGETYSLTFRERTLTAIQVDALESAGFGF